MADPYTVLADATAMIDEVYDMEPVVQEARFGATAQHIDSKVKQWAGGKMHVKLIKNEHHRVVASTDLEADAPNPGKTVTQDMYIEESDLRNLRFSLSRTIPASKEVDGSDHAVWDLAVELTLQAEEAVGEKRNQMLHQDANLLKGTIAAVYDADGTTYTSTATSAFLQLTTATQITHYHPGEIIIDSAGVEMKVEDVCVDEYFKELAIGPGIVVSLYTAEGETDTDLDNVVATNTITVKGETTGYGFVAAFGALCNRSSPGTYFGVDRTAVGNYYLIPYGRSWANASGDDVVLNIDDHWGVMADTFGQLIGPSRRYRRNRGFRLTDAIVAIAPPKLIAEASRQAGQYSQDFVRQTARDVKTAKGAKLVAVDGWDGVVLRHPSLPPIALQPDPAAAANTIRIFEPSTYSFVRMGSRKPGYVPNHAGGKWHNRRNVTTGNLTMTLDAYGYCIETPFCDQPRLTYSMEDVKSSLEGS